MYNRILSNNFTLNILATFVVVFVCLFVFTRNHTVSVGYTTLLLKTHEAPVTLLINQSSSEHVPSWFGCYGGGKS